MRFEWDSEKAKANIRKHDGVDFEEAKVFSATPLKLRLATRIIRKMSKDF